MGEVLGSIPGLGPREQAALWYKYQGICGRIAQLVERNVYTVTAGRSRLSPINKCLLCMEALSFPPLEDSKYVQHVLYSLRIAFEHVQTADVACLLHAMV